MGTFGGGVKEREKIDLTTLSAFKDVFCIFPILGVKGVYFGFFGFFQNLNLWNQNSHIWGGQRKEKN